MRNLVLLGEPERTEQALDALMRRVPAIETALVRSRGGHPAAP
jgi:hypothetical protein